MLVSYLQSKTSISGTISGAQKLTGYEGVTVTRGLFRWAETFRRPNSIPIFRVYRLSRFVWGGDAGAAVGSAIGVDGARGVLRIRQHRSRQYGDVHPGAGEHPVVWQQRSAHQRVGPAVCPAPTAVRVLFMIRGLALQMKQVHYFV